MLCLICGHGYAKGHICPVGTDDLHTYRPIAHTPVAARRPRHRDEPDGSAANRGPRVDGPQHRALPIDPYSTADRYWHR